MPKPNLSDIHTSAKKLAEQTLAFFEGAKRGVYETLSGKGEVVCGEYTFTRKTKKFLDQRDVYYDPYGTKKGFVEKAEKHGLDIYEMATILQYGGGYHREYSMYSRDGSYLDINISFQQIIELTPLLVSGLSKLPSVPAGTYYRGTYLPRDVYENIVLCKKEKIPFDLKGVHSVMGSSEFDATVDSVAMYTRRFESDEKVKTVFVLDAPEDSCIKCVSGIAPGNDFTDAGEEILLDGSGYITDIHMDDDVCVVHVGLINS